MKWNDNKRARALIVKGGWSICVILKKEEWLLLFVHFPTLSNPSEKQARKANYQFEHFKRHFKLKINQRTWSRLFMPFQLRNSKLFKFLRFFLYNCFMQTSELHYYEGRFQWYVFRRWNFAKKRKFVISCARFNSLQMDRLKMILERNQRIARFSIYKNAWNV